MDNNTAKFLADMLEESKDLLVKLLIETEGRYESQQIRVEKIIQRIKKEAEAPK